MAEGHPFRFHADEAPSTGATSLLHTAVLAAAHASGLRREGLVAFAILLGFALLVASALRAQRIGERFGPGVGPAAGAFLVLGGPVPWGFLYGADVALFMWLLLWLMDGLLDAWSDPGRGGFVWPALLLALTRPEGLPIGLLVGLAWAMGPARAAPWTARARALLPLLGGISVFGLYRVMTGSWLGSSFQDKSLLVNYGLRDTAAIVAEYGVDVVRGLLLGFYPAQAPVGFARGWASLYFPPLGLVFAGVAVASAPEGLRRPLLVFCGALGVVAALFSPNVFIGSQFNRYVLWLFPPLLVLVAAGVPALAQLAPLGLGPRGHGLALRAVWGGMLFLGALSTTRFAALYGEMAGEIYRREVPLAQWIERNLPPGTAVGHAVTSVEYLSGHRGVNLHGVYSPAFFGNRTAEREAGVAERLARLPEGERPPYLMLAVSHLEISPLWRELVDGPPLFRTMSLGDEVVIQRARYDALDRARALGRPETLAAVAALEEADRLNVCDTLDEAAHGYRFRSRWGGLQLWGTPRAGSYAPAEPAAPRLVDAGRIVLGEETFAVTARPGRDLVVVLRTAEDAAANVLRPDGSRGAFALALGEPQITVRLDGRLAAQASPRLRPGWDEVVLRIPGALVTSSRPLFQTSGRYVAFRYWFFQPGA
jgi:hypothetical protein